MRQYKEEAILELGTIIQTELQQAIKAIQSEANLQKRSQDMSKYEQQLPDE